MEGGTDRQGAQACTEEGLNMHFRTNHPVHLERHWLSRGISWVMLLWIAAYKACIRPLLIGTCKYYPSCSDYAVEAVQIHGPWRGGWRLFDGF